MKVYTIDELSAAAKRTAIDNEFEFFLDNVCAGMPDPREFDDPDEQIAEHMRLNHYVFDEDGWFNNCGVEAYK